MLAIIIGARFEYLRHCCLVCTCVLDLLARCLTRRCADLSVKLLCLDLQINFCLLSCYALFGITVNHVRRYSYLGGYKEK